MISTIEIKNFKSVQDLTLKLGRFNVFIGENGCGKSNILEAVCYASTTNVKRIDNSVLLSKGVRVVPENVTRSAFEIDSPSTFSVEVHDDKARWVKYEFHNDEKQFSSWVSKHITSPDAAAYPKGFVQVIKNFLFKNSNIKNASYNGEEADVLAFNIESFERIKKVFLPVIQARKRWTEKQKIELTSLVISLLVSQGSAITFEEMDNFAIYSPENTSLRIFEEEDLNRPLGIKGQGIFRLIKGFAQDEEKIQELKQLMKLIGWFEDFEIPTDIFATEARLNIKDRFLSDGLKFFDQRSSNEGFLFLLFYFSLFISQDTPHFFAIDNIDSSLNPKLCSELVRALVKLSNKYDKQVIVTTHNPAILDGLDLSDDNQKLFAIYRNRVGETKAKRVHNPEPIPNQSKPLLSDLFMSGAIGGLPKNF